MLHSLLLIAVTGWAVCHAEQQPIQTPIEPLDHSQGYKFDPLLHLPGVSPYFDAVGFGLKHRAPYGCNVTAASYLVRHAAIYANKHEYADYIKPFLERLSNHSNSDWTGPLSFMQDWTSPIIETELEHITPSGARDAVKVAKHLLSRYPDLIPNTTRIIADKKSRTYDTARNFVKAFPHADSIQIVRVLRNTNGSLDSLNPHKSCDAFTKEPGDREMAEFVQAYTTPISKRLRPFTPWLLTNNDVMGLQQLCGYESAINGQRSKICSVFTDAEWMAYEYAWDLKYAYMVGPLNPLSPYLGLPWLKAQFELFSGFSKTIDSSVSTQELYGWPPHQRFFLSFTHREVPPFVAVALKLFQSFAGGNGTEEFPTDRINWSRGWRMSDLIPFLGHVGLELLTCEVPAATGLAFESKEFIRVIANTAPRPIYTCQTGPGASCPIEEFHHLLKEGHRTYGDFEGVCRTKDQ